MRTRVGSLLLCLAAGALGLQGCRRATSGGTDDSAPDKDESTGGDRDPQPPPADPAPPADPPPSDPTPHVAEYGLCFAAECDPGLECTPWGVSSFCLRLCSGDTCAPGQRCDGGYCLEEVGYYEVCARFATCSLDALPAAMAQVAPMRCVPICEAAAYQTVESCPALPADLEAGAVSCTPTSLIAGKLCTAEVAEGERCDQAALRCNLDGLRPDTDGAHGPLSPGGPDPGALRCLPRGSESFCLRVCSADGGASTSPCACPVTDSLCSDPTDPGLAWDCVHWSGLATQLRACAMVETCVDDAPCADNTASGLTACKTSSYDSVPGKICQRP